jgi:hypothetical protein
MTGARSTAALNAPMTRVSETASTLQDVDYATISIAIKNAFGSKELRQTAYKLREKHLLIPAKPIEAYTEKELQAFLLCRLTDVYDNTPELIPQIKSIIDAIATSK